MQDQTTYDFTSTFEEATDFLLYTIHTEKAKEWASKNLKIVPDMQKNEVQFYADEDITEIDNAIVLAGFSYLTDGGLMEWSEKQNKAVVK